MQVERAKSSQLPVFLWHLALGLLSASLVLRPIITGSTAGAGVNFFISLLVWISLFLWFLCQALRGEVRFLRLGLLGWCLVLFGLSVFVSPFLAPYKFGAFQYSVTWLTDLILFYLVLHLGYPAWGGSEASQQGRLPPEAGLKNSNRVASGDRRQEGRITFRLLMQALLATVAVIVLYALYQYLYGLEVLRMAVRADPSLLAGIPLELKDDFMTRLAANEPFATFIYQNSLAGFLVLAAPIVLGWLVWRRLKTSGDSILQFLINLIFLALIIFIVVSTGAQGGWVALTCGLIIFLILIGWSSFSKYLRWFFAIGLLITVLTAGILFIIIYTGDTVPSTLADISPSLDVRMGYWQGARGVIGDNFWAGVGLNNFGDHYLRYKSAWAGETIHVHNDFLQVWAELGIFGLIGFLGIWLVILWKSVKSQPEADPPPADVSSVNGLKYTIIIGAALAFFMAEVFQAPFGQVFEGIPWVASLLAFLIWVGIFWVLGPYGRGTQNTRSETQSGEMRLYPAWGGSEASQQGRLRRQVGLIAGLIALLIHSTVDFNFYVHGISQTVWFIAAGVVILVTPRFREVRLKARSFGLVVIGLGVLFILFASGLWLLPRLLEYDSCLSRAEREPKTRSDFVRLVNDLKRARQINPYGVEPRYKLAGMYHQTYCSATAKRIEQPNGLNCISLIDEAISLSPYSASLYFMRGMFCYQHSQRYQSWAAAVREADQKEKFIRLSQTELKEAIKSFKRAKELYPTRPQNLYLLARVLEETGQSEQARVLYRDLLALDRAVSPKRLKLSAATRQEIIQKLRLKQ